MAAHPDSEIMYLVSPSFDILMLNAGFEGIWQRPASSFLGKKCYREIEKRDAPCPHCPGVVALRTGTMSESEGYATLDDGRRIPFLLRAYPLYGVTGEPAGFVETAEEISERRRLEDDAQYEVRLLADLLATSSTSRVLSLGLESAMRLEGADSGCVFTVEPGTGRREIVGNRGLLSEEIELLGSATAKTSGTSPLGPLLLVRAPVLCGGEAVAEVAVKLSGDTHHWPTSRQRLEALASILGSALVRIRAERLRGDATTNIQTMMAAFPIPAFFLDYKGIVTAWNEAAERLFGWAENDTLRHPPPFLAARDEEWFFNLVSENAQAPGAPGFGFRCLPRYRDPCNAWFRAMPMRDVIGDGTAYVVVATTPGVPQPAEQATVVSARVDSPVQAGAISDEGPAAEAEAGGTAATEAIDAAQELGRLLETIAGRLAGAHTGVHTGAGRNGSGGEISISWTDSGELSINVKSRRSGKSRAHQQAPDQDSTGQSAGQSADWHPAGGQATQSAVTPQALVIQGNENDAEQLRTMVKELGYAAVVCPSVAAAVDHLRTKRNGDRACSVAFVEMVMPDGLSGIEAAKLLLGAAPELRVVVSSDQPIIGHRAHRFAANISRPYTDQKVRAVLAEALKDGVS